MSVTLTELDQFHAFARQKLGSGRADSLQELLDLWAQQSPSDAELQLSLTAFKEGLEDAEAGRVRPAKDVFENLATRYGTNLP